MAAVAVAAWRGIAAPSPRSALVAPEPVALRTRRALPITTFRPIHVNMANARRELPPLQERQAPSAAGPAHSPDEGRDGAQGTAEREQSGGAGVPKRRRSRVAGGAAGGSKARTVRQTAERSKSWAALSVKQDSSRSFLSPDEEKALAAQIKELQRIEGIREDLRTAASRSLIKLTEEGSVIDTVLRVRDVEPKLGELAKACGVSVPKLQAAIEAGKRAREQLVRRNMPLVAQMATQLAKGKVGFEDVVQEGAKGLLRAAELFDPLRGATAAFAPPSDMLCGAASTDARVHPETMRLCAYCRRCHRFSTYAYRWVQVHVNRASQNHGRTIRVPVHVYERLPALARAKTELTQSLGRKPTREEVAAQLKTSADEVDVLERAYASEESLDVALQISRGFKGGKKTTLEDALESPDDAKVVEADIEKDIFIADLKSLLSTLLPKERYVLTQYFGVGGGEPRSFKQQAKDIGVSPKVVERLAQSGLAKLRHPSRAMYLMPFLDLGAGGGIGGADE